MTPFLFPLWKKVAHAPSQEYQGLQFGTLFAKIAQVFAKLWPIYRFVSKFSIISAASPRAADPKIVE
jgi:hypothetical protein